MLLAEIMDINKEESHKFTGAKQFDDTTSVLPHYNSMYSLQQLWLLYPDDYTNQGDQSGRTTLSSGSSPPPALKGPLFCRWFEC